MGILNDKIFDEYIKECNDAELIYHLRLEHRGLEDDINVLEAKYIEGKDISKLKYKPSFLDLHKRILVINKMLDELVERGVSRSLFTESEEAKYEEVKSV